MRLIDADHLIQIVCGSTILPDGFKEVFRKLVAGEPTIDRPTRSQFKRMAAQLGYEKIVHCKDCRHWTQGKNSTYCDFVNGLWDPGENDFCSCGRRKDDEKV